MSASARDLAIADVAMTLNDAIRGNFVTGDDESLAAIAVELVDQIESRYGLVREILELRDGTGARIRER